MGLKGYRLWATGQLDSNLQSPTAAVSHLARADASFASTSAPYSAATAGCSGTSVEFEKANFETRFSLDRFEG
jgi:hypothetical protein